MTQPVVPTPSEEPTVSPAPGRFRRTLVVLDLRSVWRAGGVIIVLILLYSFGSFVLHDGGSLVFQVIMAWLASIAMEPAVSRLAHHMRRGLATALVMLGVILFAVVFSAAFGNLLVSQAVTLVQAIPEVLASLTTWLNTTFGTSFDPHSAPGGAAHHPADPRQHRGRRGGWGARGRGGRSRRDLLAVHSGSVHLLLLGRRTPAEAVDRPAPAATARRRSFSSSGGWR